MLPDLKNAAPIWVICEDGAEYYERFSRFLEAEFPQMYRRVRFPESTAIGFKPVSQQGTERLVRAAIHAAGVTASEP